MIKSGGVVSGTEEDDDSTELDELEDDEPASDEEDEAGKLDEPAEDELSATPVPPPPKPG